VYTGLEQTLARLSQSFQLDRSEIQSQSPTHQRRPGSDGKHEALTEVSHHCDTRLDGRRLST
jgi:hypothetical protein